MDYFTIVLDKTNSVYLAGENINGSIKLNSRERLKINSIVLVLNGEATVHWLDHEGGGKHRSVVNVRNKEKYFSFQKVFMSKQRDTDLYLEAGEHTYPFEVSLPHDCPTSFEHKHGRVRYVLKCCIDIPWSFDKETSRSFTVLNHYDLNENSSLKLGLGVTDHKYLCCGPCKSDPITAAFKINKGGYVPGEKINFTVTIDNKSNREIKEMWIELIQSIKFFAKNKTKSFTRKVSSISYSKTIPKNSNEKWENVNLIVPPVCSSSNGLCKIIKVSYDLIVTYEAAGLSNSVDLRIPIIIGTIPIIVNKPNSKNDWQFSFEASNFDPIPFDDQTNEESEKKEVIESDANTFKPFYPFYNDI